MKLARIAFGDILITNKPPLITVTKDSSGTFRLNVSLAINAKEIDPLTDDPSEDEIKKNRDVIIDDFTDVINHAHIGFNGTGAIKLKEIPPQGALLTPTSTLTFNINGTLDSKLPKSGDQGFAIRVE